MYELFYFQLNEYSKALSINEEIYTVYKDINQIVFNKALCYFNLQNMNKAKEDLSKCLEIFAKDSNKLSVINVIIGLCNEE